MKMAAGLAMALSLLAPPAMALEPLARDTHVNATLRAGMAADMIRKGCPTIDARMLTALMKLEQLKSHALGKGHDRAEITAFIESRTEKKRLQSEAAQWLKDRGSARGDANSLCSIGRSEIADKTLIGSLLKERP